MVFFGNQAQGPGSAAVRYNVADRNGKLTKNEMIETPFSSFVHDFFVTKNYAIFPIFPLTFDMGRAIAGGLPMAWEPDRGTHFGVLPRDGTAADISWHSMDSRWSFHHMNAWEDGDSLKIDICASNATQFAPMPDGNMASEADGLAPTLRRWSIDLSGKTDTIAEELLDDLPCEFPRTDDRYMTRPYRHGFAVGAESGQLMFNRLVHFDTQSGERKTWGEDKYLFGEPLFAPRADNADEADGYLLMLAFDQVTQLSEMMIFDAATVEKGPIGRVKLPLRIPAGFHGSWVAA